MRNTEIAQFSRLRYGETMIAKTKRGRPAEFTEEEMQQAELAAGRPMSKRQLQTVAYRQRAIRALIDDDRFSWLIDRQASERGDGTWKPAILAELGRLDGPELIEAAALELCQRRPTTKEAIAFVRQLRGARPSPGTTKGLTDAIIHAIDSYRERRPGVGLQGVREAIWGVLEIISEMEAAK